MSEKSMLLSWNKTLLCVLLGYLLHGQTIFKYLFEPKWVKMCDKARIPYSDVFHAQGMWERRACCVLHCERVS